MIARVRRWWRDRQERLDVLLWESELPAQPFEQFRIDDTERGRTDELRRYIAEDAAYTRRMDGQGDE